MKIPFTNIEFKRVKKVNNEENKNVGLDWLLDNQEKKKIRLMKVPIILV